MDLILLQGTAPIPISGYLVCFAPLAAIVLGLIILFVWTDRHAARPYLRFNPFVAVGATEKQLAERPAAVGETPAGPLGGTVPPGMTTVSLGGQGVVVVPKEDVPPPAAPDTAPAFEGEPPAVYPPDLGLVTGIDLPGVDQSAVPPQAAARAVQPAPVLAITYIEYDPPGDDLQGEYVLIRNTTATAIDLTDWLLRDDGAKHSYRFPAFTIAAGGEVKLWSKSGANDPANLYWGSRRPIWNNTGDTAILTDASGVEVSRYSYGTK